MARYDYECQECKQVFEVTQKITEEPLQKHFEAQSTDETKCTGSLRKLISKTNFQCKGPGWFKTGGY